MNANRNWHRYTYCWGRGKRKSHRSTSTSVIQISNMFHICISICLCLFAIVCTTLQRTFVIDPLALCNPPTPTHTHIHPHTHIHIRMEPQSNSNPNCSSIFSNRLVSISRFLLNLPPPLAPRSLFPPPTGLSRGTTDRANWFLGRGSLHYAGTYVFKFHSCVAFFVFPFFVLLSSIYHHSYMHA